MAGGRIEEGLIAGIVVKFALFVLASPARGEPLRHSGEQSTRRLIVIAGVGAVVGWHAFGERKRGVAYTDLVRELFGFVVRMRLA